MSDPRSEERSMQRILLGPFANGSLTGDTESTPLFVCPENRTARVVGATYYNATGLVGDGTNAFAGYLMNGATVVGTLFNTDTGDSGGASLEVGATAATLSSTIASRVLAAGDILTSLFDEDGGATLPVGYLWVEIDLI